MYWFVNLCGQVDVMVKSAAQGVLRRVFSGVFNNTIARRPKTPPPATFFNRGLGKESDSDSDHENDTASRVMAALPPRSDTPVSVDSAEFVAASAAPGLREESMLSPPISATSSRVRESDDQEAIDAAAEEAAINAAIEEAVISAVVKETVFDVVSAVEAAIVSEEAAIVAEEAAATAALADALLSQRAVMTATTSPPVVSQENAGKLLLRALGQACDLLRDIIVSPPPRIKRNVVDEEDDGNYYSEQTRFAMLSRLRFIYDALAAYASYEVENVQWLGEVIRGLAWEYQARTLQEPEKFQTVHRILCDVKTKLSKDPDKAIQLWQLYTAHRVLRQICQEERPYFNECTYTAFNKPSKSGDRLVIHLYQDGREKAISHKINFVRDVIGKYVPSDERTKRYREVLRGVDLWLLQEKSLRGSSWDYLNGAIPKTLKEQAIALCQQAPISAPSFSYREFEPLRCGC